MRDDIVGSYFGAIYFAPFFLRVPNGTRFAWEHTNSRVYLGSNE